MAPSTAVAQAADVLPLVDVSPDEYARRQAVAARVVAARAVDAAERYMLFAMLGLPAVGTRAA